MKVLCLIILLLNLVFFLWEYQIKQAGYNGDNSGQQIMMMDVDTIRLASEVKDLPVPMSPTEPEITLPENGTPQDQQPDGQATREPAKPELPKLPQREDTPTKPDSSLKKGKGSIPNQSTNAVEVMPKPLP